MAEVANASWKLVRKGQLDPKQHHRIAAAIARPFDLLAPLTALLPRAAAIALELDHPIYDCFYLALSEARTAPLVTEDRGCSPSCEATIFHVQALQLPATRLSGGGDLMPELREITTGLRFPEGPVAMADGSVVLVEIARRA